MAHVLNTGTFLGSGLAQLAERAALQIPEDMASNLAMSNFYIEILATFNCSEETKKRLGNGRLVITNWNILIVVLFIK